MKKIKFKTKFYLIGLAAVYLVLFLFTWNIKKPVEYSRASYKNYKIPVPSESMFSETGGKEFFFVYSNFYIRFKIIKNTNLKEYIQETHKESKILEIDSDIGKIYFVRPSEKLKFSRPEMIYLFQRGDDVLRLSSDKLTRKSKEVSDRVISNLEYKNEKVFKEDISVLSEIDKELGFTNWLFWKLLLFILIPLFLFLILVYHEDWKGRYTGGDWEDYIYTEPSVELYYNWNIHTAGMVMFKDRITFFYRARDPEYHLTTYHTVCDIYYDDIDLNSLKYGRGIIFGNKYLRINDKHNNTEYHLYCRDLEHVLDLLERRCSENWVHDPEWRAFRDLHKS